MLKVLTVAVAAACLFAANAEGRQSRASVVQKAKQRYYHADGYIKAIGKNARRTIYHPNPVIRHRWQKAVRYLIQVRHLAWLALHPQPRLPGGLISDFLCIHRYEGAWDANTGNGYYGGLQMDYGFMSTYGGEFLRRWGTADRWPVWAQLTAAVRAYRSGRGFGPWPNTARACGLL